LKYGTGEEKTVTETVLKQFEEMPKQFGNTEHEDLKKSLLDEIKTVKKQFEERENSLKLEIEQKDKIISIKEDQAQKYALLKVEEKSEKELWIKKYDELNEERGEWVRKFYSLKTYLIVFIVLFLLSTAGLLVKIV
jgi:frataxin-like iron-binding protein CyaY